MSDDAWALVAPHLALLRESSGQRDHALRAVSNGLRLAVAACSVAEIATLTGHSPSGAGSIRDSSNLHRDRALGDSAIRTLET